MSTTVFTASAMTEVKALPLAMAMLGQVLSEGIINAEECTLRGQPIGRIVTSPGVVEVLWRLGGDLRRCPLPESVRAEPTEGEVSLREHLAREQNWLSSATKAVRDATRFSELARALSPDGRFLGGGWRGRLASILGGMEAVDELERATNLGDVGPAELAPQKEVVLAALERWRIQVEAEAVELAHIAADREKRDAALAGLVEELQTLEQVFLG